MATDNLEVRERVKSVPTEDLEVVLMETRRELAARFVASKKASGSLVAKDGGLFKWNVKLV